MKMTFRWYGESDCIPLSYIRQIPNMSGVVTAVYDVPVGEVWPCDKIARLKELCEQADLEMTIRNLGKFGVRCICYNFMPVFDWFRTDLHYVQKNGAVCLAYQEADFQKLDKHNLRLPGWDESYTPEELGGLLKEYESISHEQLFENLVYFLNGIMPACDETGINMAIHPEASARVASTTFPKWRKSTQSASISPISVSSNSSTRRTSTKTGIRRRTATSISTPSSGRSKRTALRAMSAPTTAETSGARKENPATGFTIVPSAQPIFPASSKPSAKTAPDVRRPFKEHIL